MTKSKKQRRLSKKDQELLERIRAIEKSTKEYIPFEQFIRDYEKKWGVDLSKLIAENTDSAGTK